MDLRCFGIRNFNWFAFLSYTFLSLSHTRLLDRKISLYVKYYLFDHALAT